MVTMHAMVTCKRETVSLFEGVKVSCSLTRARSEVGSCELVGYGRVKTMDNLKPVSVPRLRPTLGP